MYDRECRKWFSFFSLLFYWCSLFHPLLTFWVISGSLLSAFSDCLEISFQLAVLSLLFFSHLVKVSSMLIPKAFGNKHPKD